MSKRVRNRVQTPHFVWRTRTHLPFGVLKSNNLNTEEQPAIVPKKGSKDSLADGQPDGF